MLLCFWILLAGFFLFSAEAFNPFQPLRVLPDNAKEENHSTSQIFSLVHREDGGFGVAAPMKLGIKRRTRSSQIDQRLGNAIGISVPAPKLPRHSIGETQKPSILRSRKGVKRSNEYDIVTANEPEQTDSIAIDQDGTDFSYCSAVEFGSSGKSMYMLIDTGTADTWVMGADCSSEPCSNHSIFGPQDSNTLHTTTTKFNLTYGTGTVSGVVINDTVKMAGFSIPLSFGLASIVSDDFKWYPIDGILGLGRTSPDAGRFPTVMEAIKTNNLLQKNILGIYLQRIKDGNTNGELNFGSPDTTKYTGGLSYTNTVSDKKRWEIPIDDANVNGVACNFSGKSAIIDTGTTFVILPPVDAQRFHSLIPGSQQTGESFIIPCSSSLPVQIIITSIVYNISAKDYVGSPIADKNMCLSNIVGKPTFGPDKWLLGDVFLKNVYTVLDFDENRIGFGVNTTATQQVKKSEALTTMSPSATKEPSSSPSSSLLELPPWGPATVKSPAATPRGVLATSSSSISTPILSSFSTPLTSPLALLSDAQGNFIHRLRLLTLTLFGSIFVLLML